MNRFLIVALLVCFGFTGAFAQHRHDQYHNRARGTGYHDGYGRERSRIYSVDALQREALETIERNTRIGRLSRKEGHMLMKQYDRISRTEQKFSSHGRLSGRETRILTENLEDLIDEAHQLSRRHGDNWARGDRGRY